jgi:hypothetical protein
VKKADIHVGQEYVATGYPGGRFIVTNLNGRTPQQVLGRYPDDQYDPERERSESLRSIIARWDDPAQITRRAEKADQQRKGERALAILSAYGVDIRRDRLHPNTRAWTDAVTLHIDLDAFLEAFDK